MNTSEKISALFKILSDELDNNPGLASQIDEVLDGFSTQTKASNLDPRQPEKRVSETPKSDERQISEKSKSDKSDSLESQLDKKAIGKPRPAKKASGKRSPALVDPIAVYKQGEGILKEQLEKLNTEQLKDVVAEYGMDTGNLVMKWRTKERIINFIIDMATDRSKKGESFR